MENKNTYLSGLKKNLTQYAKKVSDFESSGKGEKEAQRLRNNLKDAGDAYEKLQAASADEWEAVKNLASGAFDKLKETFGDLQDTASDSISDYAHYLEEFSQETVDAGADYIKNNPFKSVLLAGFIGILIGKMSK